MASGLALDRYVERASALHRADARAKLPAALGYVVAIALTREGDGLTLALLAAPLMALVALSRLPPALVLRRSLIAAPFLLVALPLLVTREGETLATLPVVGWEATEEGARAVLTIVARSWLSVVVAVLLTASTPLPALLGALRWRARVAGHLAGTLFVRSVDRGERVHAAMLARGYDGEVRSLAPPPPTAGRG